MAGFFLREDRKNEEGEEKGERKMQQKCDLQSRICIEKAQKTKKTGAFAVLNQNCQKNFQKSLDKPDSM